MKITNIDNIPNTEILLRDEWFYVPDYVFTDSPEDYKEPIITRSWRNKDDKNMRDEKQKCIMRGSYAGLVDIASRKESGKYVYDYYLASKIGKRLGRLFKTTGQRFFYITTRQTSNPAGQVNDKVDKCIIWGFLSVVETDYDDDFRRNVRVDRQFMEGGKTLITLSYYKTTSMESIQAVDKLSKVLKALL